MGNSSKVSLKKLETVRLPSISLVDVTLLGSNTRTKTFDFKFHLNVVDPAAFKVNLECEVQTGTKKQEFESESIQLTSPLIKHFTEGTITLDELCQSEEIDQGRAGMVEIILNRLPDVDRSRMDTDYMTEHLRSEPYIPQSMLDSNGSLSEALIDLLAVMPEGVEIPECYCIPEPKHIVPDSEIISAVLGYIGEGTPCTALIGPTGAGKSFTAQYVASRLRKNGFAAITIDANSRTEGDRLFERDDFNQDGTFILEGTLLAFARETKELGLRGLVILEEYNAFPDTTRREFYRLFSNTQRYYRIESRHAMSTSSGGMISKDGTVVGENGQLVDFSHVQFLITANPITSDRYLVDDLKQLSNSEARRITMVYHDYVRTPATIIKILKAIIRSKEILPALLAKYPEIGRSINFETGANCFLLLNSVDSHGNRLGFDFGYTDLANWVWTAAIRGNTPTAWISSSLDHLINPIPDHELRKDVADKLSSKFGIKISKRLLLRDA